MRCVARRALGNVETEERSFGEGAEIVTTLDLHAESPHPASSQASPLSSQGRVNSTEMTRIDTNGQTGRNGKPRGCTLARDQLIDHRVAFKVPIRACNRASASGFAGKADA